MKPEPITLSSCLKSSTRDLDKCRAPEDTIAWVTNRLRKQDADILAETRRMDCGRLGIPVYMAVCGATARLVMPTRKQMGKGSSPGQARASAIMELMERYAFFSFWKNTPGAVRATWSDAELLFGADLIPVEEIIASVNDRITPDQCRLLLNAREWLFYPATRLGSGTITWLPIDWFRMLGEFNGTAAGNSREESLLQAVCELLERHVCAVYTQEKPILPTIAEDSCPGPVLPGLVEAFRKNNVNLVLKDMTLDSPVPCVAALAWDAATFPEKSEIVFTAGCATSPEKAAIRAITEVAQLGGDFCTNSVYEASGLEKFTSLEQIESLLPGPLIHLTDLPDISSPDLLDELLLVVKKLAPRPVYAIDMTHPELGIPAHWCVIPGLRFRERDINQSVGLFIGRMLSESGDPLKAEKGFVLLEQIYGKAHFLPFFRGLSQLYADNPQNALEFFLAAEPLQPEASSKALVSFYIAYAQTLLGKWQKAIPWLEKSLALSPDMKEAANLLGVCLYKTENYAEAEKYFDLALKIDRGSVMDLANRGICRKLQGKLDLAKQDLLNALAIDPTLDFVKKHLEDLG